MDLGGTKAHVRIVDGSGSRDLILPSKSWAALDIAAIATVARSLAQAVDVTPDALCVGASGCETERDEQRIAAVLRQIWPYSQVRVCNDAVLVLAAAGQDSGIALISGTGAIAVALDAAGKAHRAGGWGALLGDDGSAYALVRATARHLLRRSDRGESIGELGRVFLRATGAATALDLIHALHAQPDPARWAGHARVVCAAAADGDPFAGNLLDRLAAELVTLAVTVAGRAAVTGPVVLAGGLLTHQSVLRDRVTRRLAAELPAATVVTALDSAPVAGAVRLAARLVPGEVPACTT